MEIGLLSPAEEAHLKWLQSTAKQLGALINERSGKYVPDGKGGSRGIPWSHHRDDQKIVGGAALLLVNLLPVLDALVGVVPPDNAR